MLKHFNVFKRSAAQCAAVVEIDLYPCLLYTSHVHEVPSLLLGPNDSLTPRKYIGTICAQHFCSQIDRRSNPSCG